MRTPDKWIRKYLSETWNNKTVSGKVIPMSDYRLPENSTAYILLTTEDKSHDQETKCGKVWNFRQTLDIVTVYAGNTGSRTLADDIQEAVLNTFEKPQINGFTVQDSFFEFGPDLSTQSSTQSIFRKIIIYNLKLKENG